MLEKTGVVSKVFGLYYTVRYKNKNINCVLRGKIRQSEDRKIYSDPVAVGDRVLFLENDDGTGVINAIIKRKNIFSRKEKGKNKREDIIACNLDLVVIFQSFNTPNPNLRFVDRLLVRCVKEKISSLLCVNKLDLAEEEIIQYIRKYYSGAKINICMTSTITGAGIEELKKYLVGKTCLFIGNSGVGKTSILNYINPSLNLRVSEVSKSTNKGRHTTANVEMINIDDNIKIIDSPGVREFGLMDIEPHMLGSYFNEFTKSLKKCQFNPCTHDHEPNCEVKTQVEKGKIFSDRYKSYLNILYSLKEYYERQYE